MKPVVSSIVALAIAIAPFAALAAPETSETSETSEHKPTAAKVVKHHHRKHVRLAKAEKTSDKSDKSDKSETSDKPEERETTAKGDACEKAETLERVRHSSGRPLLKPVLHHAHNVDVSGAGHREPKIEGGDVVPSASLTTTTTTSIRMARASHKTRAEYKPVDLPKLPNPNATKASKSGSEKGARKPAEKKNDDDNDGQPKRDGDFADLVARIRGNHEATQPEDASTNEPASELAADATCDGKDRREHPEKLEAKARRVSAQSEACAKDPIEIIRGPEIDRFELTKCDGSIAPLALEHLSILIRPGSAARPTAPITELAKKGGVELARGVHRIDERLAMRIQALADHFATPGVPVTLSVVSGFRPTSVGSMHATGRAVDFRLEGAKNEDVIAFCKTLTDTGCGFYPNSSFVHLDVRNAGAGHVSWIDASGPGESPRYVATWPPPATSRSDRHKLEPATAKEPVSNGVIEDRDGTPEAVDAHPGEAQ